MKEWAVTGVQPSHFARKAGVTQEGSDSVTSSRKEPFQGWAFKKQKKTNEQPRMLRTSSLKVQ